MRFALGGFGLLAMAGGLGAQTTVLHCGSLIDAEALAIRGERTIVVEDGRIASVSEGFAPSNPTATTVDLRDQTCMPGLIDLHVHLAGEQSPNRTVERFTLEPADYAFRSVGNAERTLMAGFTTVRDLGNVVGRALRDAINEGRIPGPRILQAGRVASTGSHMDPTNGWRSDIMGVIRARTRALSTAPRRHGRRCGNAIRRAPTSSRFPRQEAF